MKRVVITGGGGYLAGLLADHLESKEGYEIVLINRSPRKGREMIVADLATWDPLWVGSFVDAHAVIHLAAERRATATWPDLQRGNIDTSVNVLEAAARGRVRRLVFGSSSRVLGGSFGAAISLTPETPPRPTGAYATSKAIGEAFARYFAHQRALSVVCFRIGRCHEGEDVFDPGMPLINQYRWLSPRDFCLGMELAIEAEGIEFSLLHLASDIIGSPWDISATRQILGFAPRDRHQPKPPSLRRKAMRLLARRGPRFLK